MLFECNWKLEVQNQICRQTTRRYIFSYALHTTINIGCGHVRAIYVSTACLLVAVEAAKATGKKVKLDILFRNDVWLCRTELPCSKTCITSNVSVWSHLSAAAAAAAAAGRGIWWQRWWWWWLTAYTINSSSLLSSGHDVVNRYLFTYLQFNTD